MAKYLSFAHYLALVEFMVSICFSKLWWTFMWSIIDKSRSMMACWWPHLFAGLGVVDERPVSVTAQELHHVLRDDPAPVFPRLWDPPRLSPDGPPIHSGQLCERDVGEDPVVPLAVVDPSALELPKIARNLGGNPPHALIPCIWQWALTGSQPNIQPRI